MALIDQLRPLLTSLEDNAIADALSNLPVIADDMSGLMDDLNLSALEAAIDQALASAEQITDPAARAAAIAQALDALPNVTASAPPGGSVVTIALTESTAAMVELAQGDIGLGGAAFSLEAQAAFSGSISAAVDLQFTYDAASDVLSLTDTPQDEVSFSTSISADLSAGAQIAGGLLTVGLSDTQAAPELALTAGFNFPTLNPNDIQVTYGGAVGLGFQLTTNLVDGRLPGVTAAIDITWDPLDPARAPSITFGDVGISVGDLVATVAETLKPVTDILFEGPIGTIVEVLTEPVPIVNDALNALGPINLFDSIPAGGDGVFNLLDGLGLYLKNTGNDQGVQILSDFARALGILKQLNELAQNNGVITLGSFSVAGFDPLNETSPLGNFSVAEIDGKSPLQFLQDLATTSDLFQSVIEAVPGLSEGGAAALGLAPSSDEDGLSFPIFENPAQIMNILLPELAGNAPVSLIEYDIPAIASEARFGEYFFPVFGPFGLTLDGWAAGSIDFTIGYDTFALTVEDGTFLDGLYLTTQQMAPGEQIERQPTDRQFEYRPIAFASAGIFAGVAVDAVVARVGVEGGIIGFAAAFLPGGEVAEGETPNGVLRLRDIAGGCFVDPLLGRVSAEVLANVKVGFGPFSFDYDVTIADFTLANFEFGCPPASEEIDGLGRYLTASEVILHVGPEIGNRIIDGTPDTEINETFRVSKATDEDGVLVPGAISLTYAGTFQNFGVDAGEAAPTRLLGNFGEGDDALVVDADLALTITAGGGVGNDIVEGGALADTLNGNEGNDRLFGRAGDDTLNGGDNDDYLEGGLGADIINGGAGRDRVSYENSTVAVQLIWHNGALVGSGGDAQGDIITSVEYVVGSVFNDVLMADPVEDSTLQGNAGDDVLFGGLGDDFLIGDAGADLLQGGPGHDGTSYVTSNGAVQIDLEAGTASGGHATGDVLSNIESVMGSAFYDVLTGNSGANRLAGWLGDDILDGRGDADEITGDLGEDTVFAYGDGAALLDGGADTDLLTYRRASGPVTVDLLAGTGIGAAGTDTIALRALPEGTAPSTLVEQSSFENLEGTFHNDSLTGDAGANMIWGLNGVDVIDGGKGDDTILGGFGADMIDGGSGVDWADYTDGAGVQVFLSSGTGTGSTAAGDTLIRIENLRGSDAADFLGGDDGDNILAPMLSGGSKDLVDGLGVGDIDTLALDYARNDTGLGVVGGVSSGTFERFAFDGVTLLDGVDFFRMEAFDIRGTMRADIIDTGEGNDTLLLGGGDDVADAGSGTDYVLAQEGNDTVSYRSADTEAPLVYLNGGLGFDSASVDLRAVDEAITARAGFGEFANILLSSGGAVVAFETFGELRTGEGADLIQVGLQTDNALYAGGAADVIEPGRGIDFVDGGTEVVTTAAPLNGAADFPIYILSDPAQFFDFATADLLRLDWSEVTSDITTAMTRFQSGSALYVPMEDTRVTTPYFSQSGSYSTANGLDQTSFTQIERVDITGGVGNDTLIGTWNGLEVQYLLSNTLLGPYSIPSARGNDRLIGRDGNDTLIGLTGSDILGGSAGDDTLIGSDADIATETNPQAAFDAHEIDTLTGGRGADLFVLGAADGAGDPFTFYLGRVDAENDATDSRAIITDFNAAEGDRLVLAGAASDYDVKSVNGNTEITLSATDRNLIAVLEGVETFTLDAATADFLPGSLTANLPVIPEQPTLPMDLVPQDVSGASLEAPAITPLPSLALESAIDTDTIPEPLTVTSEASLTSLPWISQTNDTGALKNILIGATAGEIASGTITIDGDARAFGSFLNDPFGLGEGIALSTGLVTDLQGQNLEDGGLYGPFAPALTFEDLGNSGGSGIFRADLTYLGTEINSITIADDGDAVGGSEGDFSGFELDAVLLSRQLVTAEQIANGFDFNDPSQFTRLDVFNYGAAFSPFQQGSIRSDGTQQTETQGTSNGLVDLDSATLGAVDYFTAAQGSGSFTMGDGGTIGFDLLQSVSTDGPLYLYVSEGAANEDLKATITASDTRLAAPADMSTDFGAEGAENDLTRLTYSFDLFEDAGKEVTFDFVLATEELREFAGTGFNDALRIYLNGVQLAHLSDGKALTVSQLMPSSFGPIHPDLILNPVSDGPLADLTKADAYTTQLSYSGVTRYGRNELVIEVEDVRDGFLDTAVLIKGGTLDVVDTGLRGVVELAQSDANLDVQPGLKISNRDLRLEEGGAAMQTEVTLTGIAGLTEDVSVIFTPGSPDIDFGTGPGNAFALEFGPGGPLTQTLEVSGFLDGIVEPTEIAIANVAVKGAAAYDGLPVAPLAVTVSDVFHELAPLNGTNADDVLTGTEAPETLNGFGGHDILNGAGGKDILNGGFGNDTLNGNDGDDILAGDAGNDLLDGGAGHDLVSYESSGGRVSVFLNRTDDVGSGQGVDTFVSIEGVIGSDFDDRINGDAGDNTLVGGLGDDVIVGLAGNDHIDGGNGNDDLTGSGGDDHLIGGFGFDRMFGLGGADTFDGGGGDDHVEGGLGIDTVEGGGGNDDIFGFFGADVLSGGTGNDNIRGDGSADLLSGGLGNDRLVGGNGKDTLAGDAGNDILFGGAGTGGGDGLRDVFVFKSSANGGGGFDIIRDFEDTLDKIDVSQMGYASFADILADASQAGGGVEINWDFAGLLRIDGMTLSNLTAGDFIF